MKIIFNFLYKNRPTLENICNLEEFLLLKQTYVRKYLYIIDYYYYYYIQIQMTYIKM